MGLGERSLRGSLSLHRAGPNVQRQLIVGAPSAMCGAMAETLVAPEGFGCWGSTLGRSAFLFR